MKKLLRTVALLLLPLLLYFGLFLAFEPNNYFGLRATTPSGAVFGALRQYQKNPVPRVIVGDSRLAHLDMNLVQEVAGQPYGNLAFGGASPKETLDLLEYWLEEYPFIEEVVFEFTFYTFNQSYSSDRFSGIKNALHNPVLYLTNFSFNLEAMQNMQFFLQGKPLGGGDTETKNPADYTYENYTDPSTGQVYSLEKEIASRLPDIYSRCEGWQLNQQEFSRLLDSIEKCAEKGIRFIVVMPPVHPMLRKLVIEPLGIDQGIQPALQALHESSALVLDYEFENPPDYPLDFYFDGLHLDYKRGLPFWTEELFEQIRASYDAAA